MVSFKNLVTSLKQPVPFAVFQRFLGENFKENPPADNLI
jgi:hypothetical protein